MATMVERIASLEASAADNARQIGLLHDAIHGGPTCEWPQSIRGRLHAMQSAIDAADRLADATRELVRERHLSRGRRLKTWQWIVSAIIAAAVAAAPYVTLFVHAG